MISKKFDQPNTVGYSLTESEFQSIINDKLKIQYDEYGGATIVLHLESKKSKADTGSKYCMNYKKKNDEGNLVKYTLQIHTYFNSQKVIIKMRKKNM